MPCLGQKRILLVDDDPIVRRATRLRLEQEGFECREADHAVEALALLDAGLTVDVIVSDYHMPSIDGLAFLRALSYRISGQGVAFIMVSGNMTKEAEREILKHGAVAVLNKPVDFSGLLDILHRTCRDPEP